MSRLVPLWIVLSPLSVNGFFLPLICDQTPILCLVQLSETITFRHHIELLDIYDRLTGRNAEINDLRVKAAELKTLETELALNATALDDDLALAKANRALKDALGRMEDDVRKIRRLLTKLDEKKWKKIKSV